MSPVHRSPPAEECCHQVITEFAMLPEPSAPILQSWEGINIAWLHCYQSHISLRLLAGSHELDSCPCTLEACHDDIRQ